MYQIGKNNHEGYNAKILAKSSFKGSADADIEAWRDDAFSSIRIYVQVKHHGGYSGRTGINQIIQAVQERNNNGSEFKGVFITSANVADDDKKYAEHNNIVVIDGNRLVEIIIANLRKLSETTIKKLGIVMVPSILDN